MTFHEYVAGEASLLPAASMATTAKLCLPRLTSIDRGDEHGDAGAPSTEQVKLASGSLAENLKTAFLLFVFAGGCESIFVSGAVVSGGGPDTA